MRNLHVIMPMAGEGSRFLKEGWITPKPLIDLNGKPLFMHAISSVMYENIDLKYSFIVRKSHIKDYNIDKQIKSFLPKANVFSVSKTTRGAVETCLMAESAIRNDDALIVMDCDLEFRSEEFKNLITEILKKDIDCVNGGALVSFESQDARYSYAKVNHEGFVLQTAEKKVISNHALCGAYFFSRAQDFLKTSHRLVNSEMTSKEFYTSLLYNYLLDEKQSVKLCSLDEYYSYGTPEELRRYMN